MNYLIRITSLIIFILSINNISEAKLLVSKLYSDHMVIQRNQPIVVWGWTDANKNVIINFNNSEYSAISNDKGDWKIILPNWTLADLTKWSYHLTMKRLVLTIY